MTKLGRQVTEQVKPILWAKPVGPIHPWAAKEALAEHEYNWWLMDNLMRDKRWNWMDEDE